MKNVYTLALLAVCLFTGTAVAAQTPAQLKKLLIANTWKISHSLVDGKKEAPDKSRQGASLTFNKAGLVAIEFPADTDPKPMLLKYEVTDKYLVLGENIELPHYRYKFEDGYLFLTDADMPSTTTVWKQGEATPADALAKASPTVYATHYAPTPKGALSIIQDINDMLKEAVDNLVFFRADSKETIKEAVLAPSETGVRLTVKVLKPSGTIITEVADFVPENFVKVSKRNVDNSSPVGYLRIDLDGHVCSEDIFVKGSATRRAQVDNVYLPYLKIDEANYGKLETLVRQLANWYEDKTHRLATLEGHIKTGEKFWVSANSVSKTYGLYDVFVSGGTIKFYYTLEAVSARGDSRGDFVTVVPLADIDAVSFDKSKSRPNTIILKAGKYGFATYSRKDIKAKYENTGVDPVSELPLFINVSDEALRERVMELLQAHVKELGGGKLKL